MTLFLNSPLAIFNLSCCADWYIYTAVIKFPATIKKPKKASYQLVKWANMAERVSRVISVIFDPGPSKTQNRLLRRRASSFNSSCLSGQVFDSSPVGKSHTLDWRYKSHEPGKVSNRSGKVYFGQQQEPRRLVSFKPFGERSGGGQSANLFTSNLTMVRHFAPQGWTKFVEGKTERNNKRFYKLCLSKTQHLYV